MNFSVLISIYHKEKVEYFYRAMQSIWDEQTVKPDDIVLVQDGELTKDLYEMVNFWREKLGETLQIVSLKQNVGLGEALNIGLEHCKYELIARMDTDDIARKDRFEKQLNIFKNNEVDICSSWVSEFDENENEIISYRKLPEFHEALVIFSKKRNPINHPAVMYKKSIIQKVGSYRPLVWFEDYYLWARMLLAGAKFYNIQEPLVNMRAGYRQLQRRSGLKYALNEVNLQIKFLNLHFINIFEFIRNIGMRFFVRLIPKSLLKHLYKRLRD